jgi:hypothetical protein
MTANLPFAGVRLRAMPPFISSALRPLLVLTLCLSLSTSSHAQRGAWLDIVPMTRNLFGADDAQDLSFAVGWSSATTENGWRALVGFDLSEETQDNFGTAITTTNRRIDLRIGRRWRMDDLGADRTCWVNLGTDLLLESDHIGTESSNPNFTSSNTTNSLRSGFSGVLGVQCRITRGFHIITEARMDAVYISDITRVSDSFGGSFEQVDNGWNARISPPLQLLLVLDL